ncbi:MAG: hypothetical protein IJB97_05755, partial [Clostridia bacterium]|nr:hypothetical protein [Clostridia bacterium]
MRSTFKKLAYLFACFGVLASVGGAAACNKESNNTIRLNISNVSLDRYEVSKLKATVTGNDMTVEWSSSNTAVLTVDENGNIYPQGEGDAIVTAAVDGASAICNVSVTDLGEVPLLSASFDETQILIGMTKSLDLTILYKGKKYDVTDYSIVSYGAAVTVENGEIKGASVGTAEVQITGNWRGFQDAITVTVNVIDDTLFYFETPDVIVYTEEKFKGNTFTTTKQLEPIVMVNGKEETAAVTYTSQDLSIATVNNDGVITGVGFGTTAIEGKVTVDGREYTALANVRVSYPEANDDTQYYLEKSQNNIIDFHAFNEEIVAIMDMSHNTLDATIVNNVVTMPPKDYLYLGTDEYKLVTAEEHVYNVKVNNVTYAISDVDELWAFRTVAIDYSLEGYYVLDADIDFAYAQDWTRWNGYYPEDSAAMERKEFAGTFDGNGHTIDSIVFASGENMISSVGFIGALGDSGVIKNVAFTNVIFDGAKGAVSGLIGECYGIVNNIYLHVKEFRNDDGDGKIAILSDWIGQTTPKLSNVIVDLSQAEMRGSKAKGTIYVGAAVTAANSVYVIGNAVNEWAVENHSGKLAHIYEDVTAFEAANVNGSFTKGWDTAVWNLIGDYPVFNTVSVPVSIGGVKYNLTETEDFTFTFKKGTIVSFKIGETEITDFMQDGDTVTIPNATAQALGYGTKKATISTADATYIGFVKTYTVAVNGVTEYSSRVIANESGSTIAVNGDGYMEYTATNGAWDTRRVKILNAYQAGQYVAMQVYAYNTALDLGGGGHAVFWGAAN